MLEQPGYTVPSPERVIISAPPPAELRWTTATPHITLGTVSRQQSPPGSPGADFQIAKCNEISPVQHGAAADPVEIHGVSNYENQFSAESLDSRPISTLINEPSKVTSLPRPEPNTRMDIPSSQEAHLAFDELINGMVEEIFSCSICNARGHLVANCTTSPGYADRVVGHARSRGTSFMRNNCLTWNLVSAAADDGGWGQPPAAADGGGWEPEAAPEAPPADPVQDQESMVIDQPSPSSSDSVHELVDLDPQPQGDIEAEAADPAPLLPTWMW
ncbi:hypothetical protein D1007_08182 [Hordeum vulgare]|nr:hypothetical protein D1007_08182 [Hordeum vulgare]